MDLRLTHPLTSLPRCPHCGTARPTLDLTGAVFNPMMEGTVGTGWAIYRCTSCQNPVAFQAHMPLYSEPSRMAAALNGQSLAPSLMIPNKRDDLSDWPERASRYMAQAVDALGSPDGAVMLAGSAVDAMLKEKGYTSGSVYERVEKAVGDNLLTGAMGEWAHSVRLSANSPRHADLDAPHASTDEARAALDFVRALAQFLFVLPARIERGRERAVTASEEAQSEGA